MKTRIRINIIAVIKMITGRLSKVREKQRVLADMEAQTARQQSSRQFSTEVNPRSVPSGASG